MATDFADQVDLEWAIQLFTDYNPHVERVHEDIAQFRFHKPEWAITATAYSSGYIPVDGDRLLKFREPRLQGIGDTTVVRDSSRSGPETNRHPSVGYLPDSYERVFSATPYGLGELVDTFPEFFDSEKKLVLLEGDETSASHVAALVDEIEHQGKKPTDFVFLPVLDGSTGGFGELFYEYLTGLFFAEKGYIATTYGSRNQRGTADIFAYRIPELAEYGGGFALDLLLDPQGGHFSGGGKPRAFTVEVEPTPSRTLTRGSSGIGQIQDQQYFRGFSGALSAGPGSDPTKEGLTGTLLFGRDGQRRLTYPETLQDPDEQTLYGFKEYAKFLLLEREYDSVATQASSLPEYLASLRDRSLEDVVAEVS